MKSARSSVITSALAAVFVVLTQIAIPAPAIAESAMKETSDATFDRDVIEGSEKNTVVVFLAAPWCGPCRLVQPELAEAARSGLIMVYSVDIDQNPVTARKVGAFSIPLVIAYKDGKPIGSIHGAAKEKLKEFLEKLSDPNGGFQQKSSAGSRTDTP